jgi:hypothetical protein
MKRFYPNWEQMLERSTTKSTMNEKERGEEKEANGSMTR